MLYDYLGNLLGANIYEGKKLSILGDSISTFDGYIPSGNLTYYPTTSAGLTRVEQTWWWKVKEALGMELLVNNSWSGSEVAGTASSSGSGTRCQSLHNGTTDPDVIIVYMGTNDFNHDDDIGPTVDGKVVVYDGTTALPADNSTNRAYFSNAYAIMLDKILARYKHAEVWCCTIQQGERNGSVGVPEMNDDGIALNRFNDCIRNIANAMGVRVIDLSACGITYENRGAYMGDYMTKTGTQATHPNPEGHSLIADTVIKTLDPACVKRYRKVGNLIDTSKLTGGQYYDADGVLATSAGACLTDWMPVKAGETYFYYADGISQASATVKQRINLFDANKVWKSQIVVTTPEASYTEDNATIVPAQDGYVRISAPRPETNGGIGVDYGKMIFC